MRQLGNLLITAWRRFSRWPGRLLGIRHFDCTLEPVKDLYEIGEGFTCVDTDPQLVLRPVTGRLQTGWYLLSYRSNTPQSDQIFVPKIYSLSSVSLEDNVRNVNDYSIKQVRPHEKRRKIWFRSREKDSITLQAHAPGRATHLFYYNFEEDGFRLDPFDLDFPRSDIPFTGWFSIKRIRLTRLGLVSLLAYSLFHALRAHRASVWRRARIAWHFASTRGYQSCLRWLIHCAYWVIQPPVTSPRYWYNRFSTEGATPRTMSNLKREPGKHTFALLLFADNEDSELVQTTINSIRRQQHTCWSLVVVRPDQNCGDQPDFMNDSRQQIQWISGTLENAPSIINQLPEDYLCLLRAGDIVEDHALQRLDETLCDTGADVVYADAVTFRRSGTDISDISLEPAFSYDYLVARGSASLLTALRLPLTEIPNTSCLSTVEALNETLILLLVKRPTSVAHVPDILIRCRPRLEDPAVLRAPARIVTDQLRTLGFDNASVSTAATPGIYRVRYHRAPEGKTAIVIPTHNGAVLVKQALDSIARTVPDHLYDVVLVDHASDEQQSLDYFSSLSNSHQVLRFEGAFNFSRINNYAVNQLDPSYESILFLNNDIEAIREGWLESMRDKLLRHDVGIVGAVLLYPDDSIQHAGVILGMGNADHYLKGEAYRDPYNLRQTRNNIPSVVTRDFSAVTAACLLIKKDLYDTVGGFDEKFAVGFGDVELCLKVRQQGRKVICDGEAVLIHHESVSRDVETPYDPHPTDTAEFRFRYEHYVGRPDGLMNVNADPFYNRLLSTGGYYRPARGVVRSHFVTPQITSPAGIAPPARSE